MSKNHTISHARLNWAEFLSELLSIPESDRLGWVMDFAITGASQGQKPLNDMAMRMVLAAKATLEENISNGRKGGRPGRVRRKPPLNQPQTNPKPTPKASDCIVLNGIKEIPTIVGTKKVAFAPPTPEEVYNEMVAYVFGKPLFGSFECPLEANRFHAYYESVGWRVGRNPMKSWKHSVKLWVLRGKT